MTETRIIIAGSRNFHNYGLLKHHMVEVLLDLNPSEELDFVIISGGANGADKLGERFAKEYGYKIVRFPAEWDKFGKKAGYLRNVDMAKYAKGKDGVLVAFWDGKSKGTKHMIDIAKKEGLRVFLFDIH